MDAAAIRGHLKGLYTYDHALDFFGELGYEYAGDDPLYREDWPESTRNIPIEDIRYLARHGDAFRVIYCELQRERLLRADQRPIIEQIARRHPFFMIVFRNQPRDRDNVMWEFVNVRTVEGTHRRLIRRISIGPAERLHDRLYTAAQRLAQIDINQQTGIAALELQTLHDRAFDVEAVTNAFFATYREVFQAVEASIEGVSGDARRLFTQRLFNRLMFIVFLEHKGWLQFQNRPDYLYALWEDYQRQRQQEPTINYYRDRLKLLFFAGLNTPNEVNVMRAGGHDQGMIQRLIGNVPYLNGGLFEQDEEDNNPNIVVPDSVIGRVLNDLFYHYNFTVTESTPQEIEVAVDPEMLGRIFEELVTGRHETGSYYTPKPVVSFMGREALKGYLQTACPGERADALAAFVDQHDPAGLSDPEAVLEALKTVRICDPACGSGAYLLGMLHELIDLRTCLFYARKLDPITIYQRKLEIIQHNLYGVDIDPFAVNIARLRLWLSLIVDFEGDNPPPLPNLDFKIETGDSLIAPDPSGGLQPDMFRRQQILEFLRLKADYLTAHHGEKTTLRRQIEEKRAEIAAWARTETGEGFDWAVEFAEVFHTGNGAGGFDIVLANPPYVRQELIKDQKPTLKRVYGNLYTGTADLYVYFYLRALQLLKPGGMLAFISSNKWLRAGYGEKLREHIAAKTRIVSITDFGELPVFKTAATFPMIFVAQQGSTPEAFILTQVKSLEPPYPDVRTIIEQSGQRLSVTLLNGKNWTLTGSDKADVLRKMEAVGVPLGEYVKGQIYRGILTGFNKAFVIDGKKRAELIAADPRSAELIKPLAVGDDIRRWRIEWTGAYLIFTRRGVEIQQYPAILGHLEQFRDRLTPGIPGGRKSGSYKWYEIQDTVAYYSAFDMPKIIFPDIAKEARSTFDASGFYVNNTTYFVPLDDLWLLCLLNSSALWKYCSEKLTVIGDASQGGRLRFFTQFVEKLPVPRPPSIFYQEGESAVHELLALRGQGPRVAELEAELNRLVYQAYDLTPAEIKLIESATNTKR